MKIKNLSHCLQFKMKKSSKQQHELEKICRIHYRKSDKMNEKLKIFVNNRPEFLFVFFPL